MNGQKSLLNRNICDNYTINILFKAVLNLQCFFFFYKFNFPALRIMVSISGSNIISAIQYDLNTYCIFVCNICCIILHIILHCSFLSCAGFQSVLAMLSFLFTGHRCYHYHHHQCHHHYHLCHHHYHDDHHVVIVVFKFEKSKINSQERK